MYARQEFKVQEAKHHRGQLMIRGVHENESLRMVDITRLHTDFLVSAIAIATGDAPLNLQEDVTLEALSEATKSALDKEFEESVQRLTTKINQNAASVPSLMERARLYESRSMYPEAIRDLDQLVRLLPEESVGYAYRAMIYARSGNDDAAIDDYDTAIRLGANDGVIYIGRARVLINLGRLDEALNDCDRAIQMADDQAAYFALRAEVRRRKSDDSYQNDLQKFVELLPDDPFSGRIVALKERFNALQRKEARREVDRLLFEVEWYMDKADLARPPATRPDPKADDEGEGQDSSDEIRNEIQNSIMNAWLAADQLLEMANTIAAQHLPEDHPQRARIAELREQLEADIKRADSPISTE